MPTLTLEQATNDYMSLAEGVGLVPEKYRNRGYEKLDFGPGEGGIGGLLAAAQPAPATAPSGNFEAFLAGIAAGADPTEFAKQLLGGDAENPDQAPARRPRRGQAATAE